MCGIAGIWNRQGEPVNEADLKLMVQKIDHRGPHARGSWVNQNLGLGHSPLKIIDLLSLLKTTSSTSLFVKTRTFSFFIDKIL